MYLLLTILFTIKFYAHFDKVTTGTYNFVSLIVKIILLALSALAISLSLPSEKKHNTFSI